MPVTSPELPPAATSATRNVPSGGVKLAVSIVVAVTDDTTAGLEASVPTEPPDGMTSSAATPPPNDASVPTEFAPGVPVGPL